MNGVREISRREKGNRAEDLALDYLLERGLSLKERNWRKGHLEVDLIMESDCFIHIVEVRSLSSEAPILPKETVLWKKQRFLIKAASSYVYTHNVYKEVVFDIVSVVFRGTKQEIEYIPNAFIPFCRL